MSRLKFNNTFGILAIAAVFLVSVLYVYADAGKKHESDNKRAWLGVYMQDIDEDMAEAFDLSTEEGVLVDDVVDDSPAEEAGIKRGDVIVEFDGGKIENSEDLARTVRKHRSGDEVEVKVLRDSDEKTFTVELGETKGSYGFSSSRSSSIKRFATPGMNSFSFFIDEGGGYLGVSTIELSEQLAEYFGTDGGVLVSEVEEDSPAEKVGIKAGDVITRIDDEIIDSPSDLYEIIRDHEEGDEVKISVVRKGNTEIFTAKLDETEEGQSFGGLNPMIMNMPKIPSIDYIKKFDFDKSDFEDEMDELRDELESLREEFRELKENLD